MRTEHTKQHAWMLNSGFGDRLRIAREKAGLTQLQVGIVVGGGQAGICKYESAMSCPSAHRVAELAQMYGCTVGYLYGESEYERVSEQ